jgi:uncharacterized membrane protein
MIRIIYIAVLAFYLILLLIEAFKTRRKALFIVLSFLTHITYGLGFIMGLLKKNLKSEYRK